MNTHHCPRCATDMRPFKDGSRTGWLCPACGEVVCKRTPQGYCVGLLLVTALVGVLIFLFADSLIPMLVAGGLWIALLLVGAVIIFVPAYVCYWWIKNRLAPETSVMASVVRKRTRDWEIDAPKNCGVSPLSMVARSIGAALGQEPGVTLSEWSDYFITFQTHTGEQEFAVPEDVYIELEEGQKGLLVYRGEAFQRFVQDALSN